VVKLLRNYISGIFSGDSKKFYKEDLTFKKPKKATSARLRDRLSKLPSKCGK
jgi:hypothetical protein